MMSGFNQYQSEKSLTGSPTNKFATGDLTGSPTNKFATGDLTGNPADKFTAGSLPGDLVGNPAERALTVSQINKYINDSLRSDPYLNNVWVKGEISNFRPHYSGHMYFTLKDSSSSIKCVMFKSAASRLRFNLENGMKTVINGSISVFERDGAYQLYCEEIVNTGVGDLYTAFEQLKKKLRGEGLFDESNKKPLPMIPKSVSVVTSETGSVIKDIINVAKRRFPKANITIFPVQVQGVAAAPQISYAIGKINELAVSDVIIVARGGGSLEDLWPFNDENVARAIYASSIPVVSAVGHETDITICDFVSDLRAPTPSAAAELVFPDMAAIMEKLRRIYNALKSALTRKHRHDRERLNRVLRSPAFAKPLRSVEFERMKLDIVERKLASSMRLIYDKYANMLSLLSGKLNSLSPLAVLSRGYSVTTDVLSGAVIKSAQNTCSGQHLLVRFHDGGVNCQVTQGGGSKSQVVKDGGGKSQVVQDSGGKSQASQDGGIKCQVTQDGGIKCKFAQNGEMKCNFTQGGRGKCQVTQGEQGKCQVSQDEHGKNQLTQGSDSEGNRESNSEDNSSNNGNKNDGNTE